MLGQIIKSLKFEISKVTTSGYKEIGIWKTSLVIISFTYYWSISGLVIISFIYYWSISGLSKSTKAIGCCWCICDDAFYVPWKLCTFNFCRTIRLFMRHSKERRCIFCSACIRTCKASKISCVASNIKYLVSKDSNITCVASNIKDTSLNDSNVTCVTSNIKYTASNDSNVTCVASNIKYTAYNDSNVTCVASNIKYTACNDSNVTVWLPVL